MPDFSLTQQKGSLLLKNNQPKSSNPLLEAVGSMYDKTTPVKNIVKKSATSVEVAQNAAAENSTTADMPVIDNTLTGVSSDLTPANSAGTGMNVKTNGGDEKKYQLGFSLYGYKSIIQKNTTPQNNMNGLGSRLQNSDIAWLASIYNLYENNGEGFNQNEIVKINKAKTDGAGLTIGAWSITQKHNFKDLAKYMRDYGLPEQYCQVVELGDGKQCDVNLPRNKCMVI